MEIIAIIPILSSRPYLLIYLRNSCKKISITFGVSIKMSIIRLVLLKVTNLSVVSKIFVMVMVICGIKNSLYHASKFLFFSLQSNFKIIRVRYT